MNTALLLLLGLLCAYLGLAGLVLFALPRPRVVAKDRRRPHSAPQKSMLNRATSRAVGVLNTSLRRRDFRLLPVNLLEKAGLRASGGELVIWCGAAALTVGVLGALLAEVPGFILGAALGAIGVIVFVNVKASRRQFEFTEQLPDTLQLLAGSMRAGHSFLRALDSAAEESEAPMNEELRRMVNESRIGRDLVESMVETASRMNSEDFLWTAQAVETQREVGGNLTEVLENVQETIRERAQLNRQVKALSAEGRMSGMVLIILPIVMLVLLSLLNPTYAQTFFGSPLGWGMLIAVTVLLAIGWFWISRLVKAKF